MTEGIRFTIGIDLGDRYSHFVCLDQATGEEQERGRVPTSRLPIEGWGRSRAHSRIVMEVGTHSPWVSRTLRACGHEVLVANPRRVRLIARSTCKTDELDARALALLGRVEPRLLFPVQHRGEGAQADLAVLKARDGLIQARTQLINMARGLCKAQGVRLPKCDADVFARRARPELPEALRSALEPVLDCIVELTQSSRALHKQADALCDRYPETRLLRQVPGVGSLISLGYVLTLSPPDRRRSNRSAGAFVGLVPKVSRSGTIEKQLRITKAGSAFLRRLLMQGANYILGPNGPDTDLRRWGERLEARGGGSKVARRRAKVAVARKLSVLLHALWRTGEVYEPLRNSNRSVA